MNKTLRGLWVVVCGLGSMSLVQPAAAQGVPTQPDSADHYITYTVLQPVDSLFQVILDDQFLANTTFHVRTLRKLLPPIDKFHGPVPNPMFFPFLHYKWWTLEPVITVNRSVLVRNQFSNNSRWRILHTEFILAPTLKSIEPGVDPPTILPDENHYLCYRAFEDTARAPILIGWRDQFRQGNTQVMEAEFFCNPCRKTRFFPGVPPRTYPIVRPEVHLALYRIDASWPSIPVSIRDQFGLQRVFVAQTGLEYIVVPSFKKEPPTPTIPETWGGIKSMYR
jgi:hypothetical protein